MTHQRYSESIDKKYLLERDLNQYFEDATALFYYIAINFQNYVVIEEGLIRFKKWICTWKKGIKQERQVIIKLGFVKEDKEDKI